MGMFLLIVLALACLGLGVWGLRYNRNRHDENAHTLDTITARRQAMGVDMIEDPRERRAQQIQRGAHPAMRMPEPERPDGWPDGYSSPYGPQDADLTDRLMGLDPDARRED